jgi:hypothetical protein
MKGTVIWKQVRYQLRFAGSDELLGNGDIANNIFVHFSPFHSVVLHIANHYQRLALHFLFTANETPERNATGGRPLILQLLRCQADWFNTSKLK